MFRNQYDSDVTVWSPQGRIFQIEYAMEAVNLGTATVGLKNTEMACLVALTKPNLELGVSQPKIISIDEHLGISIAGITADARSLSKYLRTECLSYKHSYTTNYPVVRLVNGLANKMQITTQRYDRRPFGVGLLLAGYDEQGTHIYQVMPSANAFNCKAMAIGARCQGARTYLGRKESTFPSSTNDEIICHGIQAINNALSAEEQLTISVGIVGKNQPFKLLSDEEVKLYIDMAQISGKIDTPNEPDDAENADPDYTENRDDSNEM